MRMEKCDLLKLFKEEGRRDKWEWYRGGRFMIHCKHLYKCHYVLPEQ
jgi:hypothetical protein